MRKIAVQNNYNERDCAPKCAILRGMQPASSEAERVILKGAVDVEIIVPHAVVLVQFLNTTFSVVEGEITDLTIFSTSTAPFNITLSASLDAGCIPLKMAHFGAQSFSL